MPPRGGGPGRLPRIVRVRRLARALHRLLGLRPGDPPTVIGDRDWRKLEILAFGIDAPSLIRYREALTVFGIVTPISSKRSDGAPIYHAWLVHTQLPVELNELGEDLDDGDAPIEESPDEAPAFEVEG